MVIQDGAELAGADLRTEVESALAAKRLLTPLLQRLANPTLAEQAAVLGAFQQDLLDDPDMALQVAEAIARRRNRGGTKVAKSLKF